MSDPFSDLPPSRSPLQSSSATGTGTQPATDAGTPRRRVSDQTGQPDQPGRSNVWQKWEMNSVYAAEEAAAAASREAALRKRQEELKKQEFEKMKPAVLIDDAEIARLRDAARRAGEEEGYKAGHDKGWEAGYKAGHELAQDEADRLALLLESLPPALKSTDTHISDSLITLAFDIARKIVQKTVEHRPEQIINVVHELLQTEPALSGTPRLLVNEEDMSLIRKYFNEDLQARGWLLRSAPDITRGGCRVQAGNGELDGTIESRYARVSAALGRHDVFVTDNLDVF